MPAGSRTLHGTAIAAGQKGALIRGASGSGKSDLALRCLGLSPSFLLPVDVRLIADDNVVAGLEHGQLMLSAPATIAGMLEVRGIGIVTVQPVASARLVLVVDLAAPDAAIDRMPDPATVDIVGLAIPRIVLHPFEASAPFKLLLALYSQE